MVIYLTTNLITQEKYIGKDRNNSPSYFGGGVDLKKAIKQYGKGNFIKIIIENCINLDDLAIKEIYWLEYFDAANNPLFYNKTNKSYGSINGPTKTEKYLNRGKKISQSRTGIHSEAASKSQQGIKKPNVSQKLKGKKKTEEHCKNLSIAKTGIPSPKKGKPDLKQKDKPKPGAGGKGQPKIGAGPKTGKYIIDTQTNQTFTSVKKCMEMFGIHKKKMYILLKEKNGRFKYQI